MDRLPCVDAGGTLAAVRSLAVLGRSLGTDYFRIADHLTPDERRYLARTRQFVDDEVLPVIDDYWNGPSSRGRG